MQSTKPRSNRSGVLHPAVDTFMGAVQWTKNRMVIVYLRKHAGREYVRLRTFNRHQVKGVWYPAPRFYMVPIASAKQLGETIMAAAAGEQRGPVPAWYFDFEKQYNARSWQKPSDEEPADAEAFERLGAARLAAWMK